MAVMANHVHLLLDLSVQLKDEVTDFSEIPEHYNQLFTVINKIKGGGARDVNVAIGRKGPLWGAGYYDRYIRNAAHLRQAFWYNLRNAQKAGLVERWEEYPFVYADKEYLERLKWEG
ncbi:MAG: hypothetical protein AAF433_11730 [Bacteroidota bacterium]